MADATQVGINYIGTNHPLKGCINDVKNMHKFICGTSLEVRRYYSERQTASAMPKRTLSS